uniref:Serine carboxypeptidase n=1 Tax=Kalanchoe fedtschenkoi TaxID=63787 RepID=A0A7N0TWS8_KALFE
MWQVKLYGGRVTSWLLIHGEIELIHYIQVGGYEGLLSGFINIACDTRRYRKLEYLNFVRQALRATTPSPTNYAIQQVERLVNSFNLSPKKPVNIIHDEAVKPAELVESRFTFPGLVDPPSSNASLADLGHHAGYYPIKHSYDAKMFYFSFESRASKADPVVIWLSGGPGWSSSTLRWNDYGWDKASNILFVDQPTGTGFSYNLDKHDIRHNEAEFYVGHYTSALASRINEANKAMKGLVIGNGLTDPELQYQAYTDFALDNKLISQ